MSLDVARLSVVTGSSVDLETRCRSIARNAVQASREAHGRADAPYTDDEVRRERIIEKALALAVNDYSEGGDHAPLVSATQPHNPTMSRINDILEKGLEAEIATTVAATQPSGASPKK
jgi:hypothetical protein